MSIRSNIQTIQATLAPSVQLVCVSKYHSSADIEEAYQAGERDFGESRVQELCRKQAVLPQDIRWHMIGHLQRNKVKYIVPFIHLIQSADSWELLETINKEAGKIGRQISVLLEIHVAQEESKTGMCISELPHILPRLSELEWVKVKGLMTMASHTDDSSEIRRCFAMARQAWEQLPQAHRLILSMGMSDDYLIAMEEGSTMVRIGGKVFDA